MKKILYILILIGSPIMMDAVDHNLCMRLSEETRVLLYDSTCKYIIDTLKHNISNEDFIMFRIDSCCGDMIYVQPYWSLDGELYSKKGWVQLSDDITIYPHDYIFPLYTKPSYLSDSVMIEYKHDELPVLKYSNGWIYTNVYDYSGKRCEGWLSPLHQCDNPYTTCN